MARSTRKSKDASPSETQVTDVTAEDTPAAADVTDTTGGASAKGAETAKRATAKAAKVEDAIILGNDSATGNDASADGEKPQDVSAKDAATPHDIEHESTIPPVTDTETNGDDGTPDASATSRIETPQDTEAESAIAVVPAPETERGSGFVPLLLGGVLAGAIGFAAAFFLVPASGPPILETERIDALAAEVEALKAADAPPITDLAPIERAQADLTARLDMMTARLDSLETRDPSTVAVAPDEAVDASTTEIDALRAEIGQLTGTNQALGEDIQTLRGDVEALRTGLEPRIAAVETGLAEANSLAASVEDQASALARETARNQIRLALQSGAPFAEPLAVLGDPPAALAENAETGVPSQSDLIAEFPDLSRAALRTARTTEAAGVGSLFRNAFNPRSLEPQQGSDPDAVLSRAEAAVREGDLETALTEIEALPAEVQAVLQDWTTRARARAAALAAADDYLQDG